MKKLREIDVTNYTKNTKGFLFFRIVYREVKESTCNESSEGLIRSGRGHARATSIAGNSLSPSTPVPGTPSVSSCTVEDVLLLLRHLFVITTSHNEELNELVEYSNVSSELYSSKKITNKLLQVGVLFDRLNCRRFIAH